MPSSVNASGRRKVRCPKCTALLTEPQTQIYECPICSTLLLAKGNLGGRSSESRTRKDSGDARDIQQIVEGGSKLEKARFIDEFNSEQVQQGMDNVESTYNVGFQGRSRTFQPDLSYESTEAVSNIPSEGHLPSDLDNKSLSGTRFSKHTTQSVNDSVPKSTDLTLESPPDMPDWRSPHLGDTSHKGESEHQFSELDSASRTESEADLDSPTWSSDNANIKELPEVPCMNSSFEASSPIDRSQEYLSTVVSIPSIGPGGNDGANRLEEESKRETRQQSNARFGDRSAEVEILHEERHQSLSPDEGDDKEVLEVEKKLDLDSRSKTTEVLVAMSSAKSVLDEGCMPKDQNSWESCTDKGIDRSRNSSPGCPSNGLAGTTGITSPQINPEDRKEVSNIGKFRLFDLSVFGIYNEETYSELRRGKAAHYSKLSESGSDGVGLQSTADVEQRPHSSGVDDSNYSHELDCAGGSIDDNVAEVQKSSNVSESLVVGTVSSHTETGRYHQMSLEAPQQDSDVRSSVSVGQEVADGDINDLEDAGLLPVTSVDIDALANARYGDILAVKDLVSSIDISFGDWRSQQVVKPPHKDSEQNHVDSDSVHEKRMLNMVTGEGTDSSWDDDEELTFSSTSKDDAKFKGTAVKEIVAQTSSGTGTSSISQAKSLPEKPAFPLRTTAMQKFLKREDQEIVTQAQSQSFMKADSKLYEAPYMEHYTPPPEQNVQGAHQTLGLMSGQNVNDLPNVQEDKPLMITVTASEDSEKKLVEFLNENPLGAHSSLPLKVDNGGASLHPLSPNAHSRKESDSARSPQRDATVDEMDQMDLKMVALDSRKVDYWLTNKVGTASGKPASLRWKGKGGSSTQSLSSTEDEGAYGTDFEAGSGPDRASTKKQGIGVTEGHTFPDKEVKLGLGQQPRGHNQPNARVSQRSSLGNIDVDRQKHGSGENGSRRTARSRPSNERLSSQGSFEQTDRLRMEGRISNLDTSGRSAGFDRQEQVPPFQGQALNLNSSMLDQGLNYSYNGTADYNSDHSSRSQEVPPRSQYNDRYMSSSYGLPSATSARGYPFQDSPHGSVPPAPLHEQGLSHPAHHCTSPSCSLCMQQQYYMQQPQMLQNVMLHPCAACASQSLTAAYQPMHHEMHGHHMHASIYSNPSLRQHDSGAQSRGQNRSSIQQSHPVPSARRLKLHPPLPGKGAPPYVLCRACNLLLQVPGYLPPLSEPIQKLHCGACGKTSKFSVAASPSATRALATDAGSAMNASDMQKLLARDKRRTSTASVHSSEQIISSVGLSPHGQNLYGMARHTSGQGSQHEWVENRSFLHPNAPGISSSQTESVRPLHHPRPMAGGLPGQAHNRSQGRHGEGEHIYTNTGHYNEDYASSSPSSASGSSPGRHSQMGRQIQQVEPHRTGRPGFGERNLSADLPALSTMHTQGRSPFEAPSFSDGFFQKGANEGRSRFSSTSLQGSLHDSSIDSHGNEHFERLQATSKEGSWHNQPADAEFSERSSSRNRTEQIRKMPAAPGSPLVEHFTQDAHDHLGPTAQHRHMLQNSGNGSRSAPWSPASGSPLSPLFDPYAQETSADFNERSRDRERPPLPNQDASKGPKSFAGLLKRSIKDLGKGGQGGSNRRKVVVNGHLIPEAAVRKAEEQAGAIHSGTYWYDYQAGFWGVMGGPCLGILMPFIEELNFPLARDCAGGTTGILVNGRELHEKDLEVLAKRGLPKNPGRAYILDISGALFDDVSGQPLKGLGKLAPSIEKKGRGFGMSQFTALP